MLPRSANGDTGVPPGLQGTIAVVVPTYNTGKVIPAVLHALVHDTQNVVGSIVVIDNASTDGTPEIVERVMADDPVIGAKVRLLRNPRNLGYGGSIKRGFAELTGSSELVAVMHSDQQCDSAATVLEMARALALDPHPDVVLASRFMQGAETGEYSLARRLGNVFFNTLTRVVSGLRMSDAGTGIMVARSRTLAAMPYDRLTSGLQFHPQLNLLIYSDPELVVAEVPLSWRDADVGVAFSLTTYAMTLTRMLLVFGWNRRIRRRPLAASVVAATPPEDV